MSIHIEYNTAKRNLTKLFKMDQRRGVPYKSMVFDIDSENSDENQVDSDRNAITNYYRTHIFDRSKRIGKKCKKFIAHIFGPFESA